MVIQKLKLIICQDVFFSSHLPFLQICIMFVIALFAILLFSLLLSLLAFFQHFYPMGVLMFTIEYSLFCHLHCCCCHFPTFLSVRPFNAHNCLSLLFLQRLYQLCRFSVQNCISLTFALLSLLLLPFL